MSNDYISGQWRMFQTARIGTYAYVILPFPIVRPPKKHSHLMLRVRDKCFLMAFYKFAYLRAPTPSFSSPFSFVCVSVCACVRACVRVVFFMIIITREQTVFLLLFLSVNYVFPMNLFRNIL